MVCCLLNSASKCCKVIVYALINIQLTIFCHSVDQRVAICIWRLATNVEFRTISHLFGIGQSTAVTIAKHVASEILNNLLSLYIRAPSQQELKIIIQGFRDRWGFPQCGGAIDGTHIEILAPPVSSADYYNRKDFYSVILPGLVDHQLWFWDINVGWPGKVHDARGFANSSLFERNTVPSYHREVWSSRCASCDFGGYSLSIIAMVDETIPRKSANNPCTDHLQQPSQQGTDECGKGILPSKGKVEMFNEKV